MSSFNVQITRPAQKDIHRLSPKLKNKIFGNLTELIAVDPFQGKKLIGDLESSYSFRLTFKERIVYSIDAKRKIVYIERAKTDGQ